MSDKFELRPDQMEDLVKLISRKKHLLLNEPGCGKTVVVVVNQYRRWSVDKMKTVWVMPKSLMAKNVREILRFTNFQPEDVVIVDGTPKKVKEQLASGAKVFLMGPARFRISYRELPADVKAIDVDEFHLCFAGGTSKATEAYLDFCNRRALEIVPMTGTLINGKLDTAWSAIHSINPRYYPLGYPQFLARHAFLDDYGKPISWRDHVHLGKIIIHEGTRRTFASIFGHQEVVIQLEHCDMHPAQKALYDQWEGKAMIELDKFIIDGSEGPALIRARQLIEHPHHFPDLTEPGKYLDLLGGDMPGKEQNMLVHVEDHGRLGTPFVVFSSLVPQQSSFARVINEAKMPCGLINAAATAKKRGQIDELFVGGQFQGLVCSTPIGCAGYNWQFWGPERIELNHILYPSLPYLDGDFIQSYCRAIRGKRKEPLRVTVLTHNTPIEHRVMDIIEEKSRDANKVDPTRPVIKFPR